MRLLEIGPGKKSLQPIDGIEWETLQRPDNNKYPAGTIQHDINIIPWPIESNLYNIVYMSHVLEHIAWTDTIEILKEVYRILASGGRLEIFVPDFNIIVQAFLKKKSGDKWKARGYNYNYMYWVNARIFTFADSPHHKACFSDEHLKYCLQKAGFGNIKRNKNKPRGHDHGKINLGMVAKK